MFKDIITLIDVDKVSDGAGGYQYGIKSQKNVFAFKKSASRSEFYLAQQADLEVEAIFKIYLLDYSGEKTIKHKNDYFSVIRTFEKGNFIELTCQKRIGGLDEIIND